MNNNPTINAGGKIEGGGSNEEFITMEKDGKRKKVPKSEQKKWEGLGAKVVQ
jgi:hypothetical protein